MLKHCFARMGGCNIKRPEEFLTSETAAVSIGYPVADIVSVSIYGHSIGEHLDSFIESRYGSSTVSLPWVIDY